MRMCAYVCMCVRVVCANYTLGRVCECARTCVCVRDRYKIEGKIKCVEIDKKMRVCAYVLPSSRVKKTRECGSPRDFCMLSTQSFTYSILKNGGKKSENEVTKDNESSKYGKDNEYIIYHKYTISHISRTRDTPL